MDFVRNRRSLLQQGAGSAVLGAAGNGGEEWRSFTPEIQSYQSLASESMPFGRMHPLSGEAGSAEEGGEKHVYHPSLLLPASAYDALERLTEQSETASVGLPEMDHESLGFVPSSPILEAGGVSSSAPSAHHHHTGMAARATLGESVGGGSETAAPAPTASGVAHSAEDLPAAAEEGRTSPGGEEQPHGKPLHVPSIVLNESQQPKMPVCSALVERRVHKYGQLVVRVRHSSALARTL